MRQELFTVGHSTHSLAHFVLLLRQHRITAVADVRSAPASRRSPHFNERALAEALWATAEIRYVYLGRQLGARPTDPECYDHDGRVQFDRLANTWSFRQGLQRVQQGSERYRIALLCAERDPLECHRGILIAPAMTAEFPQLLHIGPTGELETHAEAEARLLSRLHLPDRDLFRDHADLLAEAYRLQELKIAWRRPRERSSDEE